MSQGEVFGRSDVDEFSEVKRISRCETGKNQPPPPVLPAHARLAGVRVDALMDDTLCLPPKLPAERRHS